jgi:DNA-binding XRE family transcriptional regulator
MCDQLCPINRILDLMGARSARQLGGAVYRDDDLVVVDTVSFGVENPAMDATEFRRLRLASGMTQESAATVLEVSHRTIVRWEAGEAGIDPLRAQAIRLRLARRIDGETPRRRVAQSA